MAMSIHPTCRTRLFIFQSWRLSERQRWWRFFTMVLRSHRWRRQHTLFRRREIGVPKYYKKFREGWIGQIYLYYVIVKKKCEFLLFNILSVISTRGLTNSNSLTQTTTILSTVTECDQISIFCRPRSRTINNT